MRIRLWMLGANSPRGELHPTARYRKEILRNVLTSLQTLFETAEETFLDGRHAHGLARRTRGDSSRHIENIRSPRASSTTFPEPAKTSWYKKSMNTNDLLVRAAQLSDHALLAQVHDLAQREREATVALIVHLAELDERRLYLAEGYSSLFKYCTEVLHLAEHATYNRIEAARAVRRFPVLLEHLAAGSVNLFAVRLLAPHLTPENHREVLVRARHESKREIEELVARLRPQPPVPDVVRKLPIRTQAVSPAALPVEAQDPQTTPRDHDASEILVAVAPSAMAASPVPPAPPARRAVVSPLAPERYKI